MTNVQDHLQTVRDFMKRFLLFFNSLPQLNIGETCKFYIFYMKMFTLKYKLEKVLQVKYNFKTLFLKILHSNL